MIAFHPRVDISVHIFGGGAYPWRISVSSAIMLFGALQIRTARLTPKHKCSIHRRPSVSPTVVHPSHNKSVTVLPITRRDADGDAMIMMQVRPGPQPVKLTARNIISIYQQDHRHRHQFSAHSYFCPRYFCPRNVLRIRQSEWLLQLTVAANHALFSGIPQGYLASH